MDYKKILEGIVNIIRTTEKSDIGFANICTYIGESCPELKESESEKIRKVLIELVKCNERSGYFMFNNITTSSMLAWLEKQGEQKPAIEMKSAEESLGIDSETYNKIVDECIYSEQKPFDYENASIRQKNFASKVEPKFKVGDWIIYDRHISKVKDMDSEGYLVEDTYGDEGVPPKEFTEKHYRLWTIQDAKDGDVLASELCGTIMLYKGIENNNIQFYCDYDFSDIDVPGDRFAINNGQHYGSVDDSDDWHPATKEQCDLLFSKMKEAGYKWDAEKKELKEIIDEKQIKKNLQDNSFRRIFEQKPAWSEEDENRINRLIAYFEDKESFTAEDDIAYANWLKSLKSRVQPKQEWSEADEYNLAWLRETLMGLEVEDKEFETKCRKMAGWLKSVEDRIALRPQLQWKPSDEQMLALSNINITGCISYAGQGQELINLYKDLKKLKEE